MKFPYVVWMVWVQRARVMRLDPGLSFLDAKYEQLQHQVADDLMAQPAVVRVPVWNTEPWPVPFSPGKVVR